MITLDYWFMFPISIVIATVAMSTGIGGALFFSPIFMLGLKIEPATAIGISIITEAFGFASGLIAYIRRKLILFKTGNFLVIVTVPLGIIGALIAGLMPQAMLKLLFAFFILFIGYLFLRNYEICKNYHQPNSKPKISHTIGLRAYAGFGAVLLGLIGSGLGEIMDYKTIIKENLKAKKAIALSVYLVAITALSASIGIVFRFFTALSPDGISQVFSIILFTVPGVLIGGQIGPYIVHRINQSLLKKILGIIFITTAIGLIITLFLA